MKKVYKVSIWILSILTIIFIATYVVLRLNTYHALSFDETLYQYQEETNGYYFFEHDFPEAVIVMYPGGLVSDEAYIPFASTLRDQGYHVYLFKMPLHLAILKTDAINDVIDVHPDLDYYGLGHSLGGAALSFWIEEHPDLLKGMIYIASYSSVDISDSNTRILSIYGTRDGVLSDQTFFTASKYYPDDCTLVSIEGGNHANYFHYGPQKGDLEACIDPIDQQIQTIETINTFIKNDD